MQPLTGVRVIDFTRLYPGPLATAWLSDYGCDVIKVEQPGIGDYSRLAKPKYVNESAYFLDVNRNKRSVSIDLKDPAGSEVIHRLLQDADVLVESFRGGTMERLGLGYKEISERYPRLIYVAVSGFGHSGPYSHIAGHDLSVTGVGGGLDFRRVGEDGPPPLIPALPISDSHGAMMAVVGVLLALRSRDSTGRGQFVDVSLVDAMASVLASTVEGWFVSGVRHPPDESETRLGVMPRYNVYQGSDGKWLTLGCMEPHLWYQFCETVGRMEWADQTEGLDNRLVDRSPGRDQLLAEVRKLFRTKTRDEWVELLMTAGVACLPANDAHEVFDDPHIKARGLLHTLDHPTEGKVKTVALPIKLSDTPGSVKCRAPGLGEHTRAVLYEVGFDKVKVDELLKSGVLEESTFDRS